MKEEILNKLHNPLKNMLILEGKMSQKFYLYFFFLHRRDQENIK